MTRGSLLLLPSSPELSTVQVLSSTNFAPIGFVFPTDGHDRQAVEENLKYGWKEVRRWHRSFSILCDEAVDEDILVSSIRRDRVQVIAGTAPCRVYYEQSLC